MSQETQPSSADSAPTDPVLATYRKSIDNIDAAIIHMLAERFRITQAVGEYKAKVTLPPADPAREARQIERLRKLAQEADLDPPVPGAPYAWRQWRTTWNAEPGEHVLSCRATDANGNVQPLEPDWDVGGFGNNAVQRVSVRVQ